ncbi:hypothetical protein AVDCRST_MAG84-6499 [uncultured Microcoleus sp.]|uniref:Uncharacterized protein n=1 Tax=uncultured Microcoleus sp. TaxID=259945 RepID=A0A6J4PCG3_9CYAN|nr:hypothetical protein AVDCRST_MAG84-6499 [uncultured Microcoleus sp.]
MLVNILSGCRRNYHKTCAQAVITLICCLVKRVKSQVFC